MTCSTKDAHRWQRCLTRLTGPRLDKHYLSALVVYGSDDMVRDFVARHGSLPLTESMSLIQHGREELFFSCASRNTLHSLSHVNFNTRSGALRWCELCAPLRRHDAVAAFWDVIENVLDAPHCYRRCLMSWAVRRRDLSLLSRVWPPSYGTVAVRGSDLSAEWLDTLVQHGWKLRVAVGRNMSFAVLQRVKHHGLEIEWVHTVHSDLDVMALHVESFVPLRLIGSAWFQAAIHLVETPGYWPRFLERFNVAWPLGLLVFAITTSDYALITWLLTHPPWTEHPRDNVVPLGDGRVRRQLIADGWFVDGKFVNKKTGERLSIVVVVQ